MDKLQQFISDNKSCPLTPMATKQLFIKFIEFLSKEGTQVLSKDGVVDFSQSDFVKLPNDVIVPITAFENDDEDPYFRLLTGNQGKFVAVSSSQKGFEYVLPSSLDLLGTAQVNDVQSSQEVHGFFQNIDLTKITSKTLLIFTYDNCFIMGMVGQTGVGKVAGLVRCGWSGTDDDYKISKVTFTIIPNQNAITVWTDVPSGFTTGTAPMAYLFALTIK